MIKTIYGSTFYIKPKVPNDLYKEVMDEVSKKFKEYYSITINNYYIHDYEVKNPIKIEVESRLR